jgi:DNA adenine methylase
MTSNISKISTDEKNGIIDYAEAKTQRGEFFYDWRSKDRNNQMINLTGTEKAFRFYFVNQFAFNGMRRFNSRGEFNVPYGNYKSFKKQHTQKHLDMLNRTEINCGDYKDIILRNDNKNTFIFLDPPYTREFTEYSPDSVFGEKEQIELSNIVKSAKNCDIMMIINKDDFTEGLYKDYIKYEYDFKYSTNIKNRYSNDVKHIVITNY